MIINNVPSLFTYECIIKTRQLIKESGEQGKPPPKIKKEFIERLIEENKCICGMDLSDNTECKNNLIELMENSDDISNISEELAGESSTLGAIIEDLKVFMVQQEKLIDNINNYNERKIEKNEMLNEVEKKLEDYDLDDIIM